MVLTLLHQLTAVWAGGILHLLALWRLRGKDGEFTSLWRRWIGHFFSVELLAVGALAVEKPIACQGYLQEITAFAARRNVGTSFNLVGSSSLDRVKPLAWFRRRGKTISPMRFSYHLEIMYCRE